MFTKKRLFMMFIPVFLEFLSSSLINALMSIMVSGLGEYAVSATSMVGSINTMAQLFFAGVSTGAMVKVSQYFGAKNNEGCEDVTRQAIALETILAIVCCVFMFVFSGSIVRFLFNDAEAKILNAAVTYLRLCVLMYPFLAVYSVANAVMYGAGDFRRTLANTLVLDVSNIAASALFIYVFKMGIAGAALGIVLSRALCAGLMYIQLRRGTACLKIRSAFTRLKKDVVWSIMRIGIPAAFDSVIVQLSNIILQIFIVKMGSTVLAAHAISMSIYFIPTLFSSCIGSMSITVVGQCFGTGDMKLCRKYMIMMVGLAWGITALTCIVVYPMLGIIVGFYNPEPATFDMVMKTFPCVLALHMTLWATGWVTPSVLRACGDVRYPMVLSIVAMLAVKLPIVWFCGLHLGWGLYGLWFAVLFEWLVRTVFIVPRVFTDKWHRLDRI